MVINPTIMRRADELAKSNPDQSLAWALAMATIEAAGTRSAHSPVSPIQKSA